MLTIRLQRTGKRNQPEFRIVVAQKTASATKKFVEVLGNYNPRNKNFVVKDEARLKYWITQQVEMSPTVHNLFVTNKLVDDKKVRAFNTPKKIETSPEATVGAPTSPEASVGVEPEAAPVAEAAPAPEVAASETPADVPAPETATPEVAVEAPAETSEAPAERGASPDASVGTPTSPEASVGAE